MTLVIAHRGASQAAPENTVEAFRLARDLGADWVELDVWLGADGTVFVHHDEHLTDGRRVASCRAGEVPAAVPVLRDALEACRGMGVNVEVKTAGSTERGSAPRMAEAVVAALASRPAGQEVLVSSFDPAVLDAVRAVDPGLPTGFLVAVVGVGTLAQAVAHGHRALHPHHRVVNAALVRACHRRGLAVHVWTCDDPDRIRLLATWGVDGIVTNVPDVARAVLGPA